MTSTNNTQEISCPTSLQIKADYAFYSSIFVFMKKKIAELEEILLGSVDITTQEYKFPEIIIIGDESNGKSSLLENITKCHIFPTHDSYCTKRPIRFISMNDKRRQFIVRDTMSAEPAKEFTSDEAVLKHLTEVFENMGQDILSENEIVIEYLSPDNHNFQFVDLPGIKSNSIELSEQTKRITNKYLAEKNNIVMLAYSALTRTPGTCSTFSLVEQHGRQQDTIMVLTMMDQLRDENIEKAIKSVQGKMENTFYVISNSKPNFDEVGWFKDKKIKDKKITENVGVDKLLAYTQELFMKYVDANWHTNIIRKLEDQKVALREEKDSFGTTESDELQFYKYFLNAIYNMTFSAPETLFDKPLLEYIGTKTTQHTATFPEIKNGLPVLSIKTWDVTVVDHDCDSDEALELICAGIVDNSMKLITKHSKALLMNDYHPNFDSNLTPSCMCSSDPTHTSVTCKALQYAGISCQDSHSQGSNRTTNIYKMNQIKNFSESLDRYLIHIRAHIETVLKGIQNSRKTHIQFHCLKSYFDPSQKPGESAESEIVLKGFIQMFTNLFTGFSYDFSSSNDVLIENQAILIKRRDFMGNISAIDSKIEKIQQRTNKSKNVNNK